jgi:hypothetical protein
MPAADASFTWQAGVIAYVAVAAAAFLVSWLATDVLQVRRPAYVAILSTTVIALGLGYLAASGMTLADLFGSNVAWGAVAGLAAAVVVAPLVRRLPRSAPPDGLKRAKMFAWEDVIYGTAEALLLATYPALAIWQAAHAAGWTGTTAGRLATGALAVLGSLVVILVHHLGYEEFRTRAARPKLLGALVSCGLQAVAFLVTGTAIAPVIAHISLHVELTMHGTELPPIQTAVRPQQG